MTHHIADRFHRSLGLVGVGTLVSALFASSICGAQTAGFVDEEGRQVLSVPAELVRAMRLPGEGDAMRRPLGLFMDPNHEEIFVGDSGNNRIVVFDRDGLYRFEFDCADHVSVPADIVVDSEGFVYVLGGSREGTKVVRFDFDGIYLSQITLSIPGSGQWMDMAIDDRDRLILVDDRSRVYVAEHDGNVVSTIDVAASFDPSERRELILGSVTTHEDELFVPVSTFGRILVFDLQSGEEIRRLGRRGTLPGELNFPVSVAVLPSGMVTVLDRMRFAVVCYSPTGAFLGEFGGKGYRDGWFYHPGSMISAGEGRVIVAQILDARVQMCQIPFFIQQNLMQAHPQTPVRDVGMTGSESGSLALGTGAGEIVQEAVDR